MPRNVSLSSGPLRYAQTVSVGPHAFQSDEPSDVGGNDAGPDPHELLMASLGVCTNITVQMYAQRHQWPLQGVHAAVSYARVLAENPADSDAKVGMVDRIEMEISFAGSIRGATTQTIGDSQQMSHPSHAGFTSTDSDETDCPYLT